MTLEEILSSRGRVRLIKALVELGEAHLSRLTRYTGLSYSTAVKHLEALEAVGLIEELRLGRVRLYRLRRGDGRVEALVKLIGDWERLSFE